MPYTRRELLAGLSLAPVAAAVRDIQVRHRGSEWSVSNGAIRIASNVGPAGIRLQSLRNLATGFDWAIPGSISGGAFGIAGRQWRGAEPPAFHFRRSSVLHMPSAAERHFSAR